MNRALTSQWMTTLVIGKQMPFLTEAVRNMVVCSSYPTIARVKSVVLLVSLEMAKHAEYVKLAVLLVKPLKWGWQKNYSSQLVLKDLLLMLATRKMVKHAECVNFFLPSLCLSRSVAA